MYRLNYHHLLYFWTVARHAGLARASDELLLSRSTLSAQIHQLEQMLGHQLLRRSGHQLILTEPGRVVFDYCERMFAIGRELEGALDSRFLEQPRYLRVGIAGVIPRLVVGKLLKPLFEQKSRIRLVCREDDSKRLLAELAMKNLDVVIDDTAIGPQAGIRGYSHLLGESEVIFCGVRAFATKFGKHFPASLDGAPILFPGSGSALRFNLERWFDQLGIRPQVAGEFDDRDLLEVVGQSGLGIFPAPAIIGKEVMREHRLSLVGRASGLREQYYVVSASRQIDHPVVRAMIDTALKDVFK